MAQYLVRSGAMSEVGPCHGPDEGELPRGTVVVLQSPYGPRLGTILQRLPLAAGTADDSAADAEPGAPAIVRLASPEDQSRGDELTDQARAEYSAWQRRLAGWKLTLELVDLEWSLDGQQLLLYVLTGRGAESTKLALYAAVENLPVRVIPVDATGVLSLAGAGGGGCSTGGSCGCHT